MAFNPNASQLSQEQIIQQVFDSDDNALNVNVEAPITISGDVMVEIAASSGDNIAIADKTGTNYLVVNPDGSINTNVTFPSEIAVTQATSPWIVSGTVTANAGTGTFAISAASLPLPTGAATNSELVTINSTLGSPMQNSGGTVTVTQTSGTNLHVDVDNFPATVAVTQSTSPWVISGAVTTSPNVNIHDGAGNSLTSQANGGQRALDVGIDVAGVQIDPRQIRTLTSADIVTVDQGGTWNLNNISGTISLPTGAATSVNQTNGNQITQVSSLPAIPAGSNNIGSITNITGTISLPTGAATSALQTTGNSSLATIVTNTTPLSTVTVLPANTASAATNISLVVALSPLSSLPTGTNTLGNLNTNNDYQGSGSITSSAQTVIATTNGCSTVVFTILGTWSANMLIEGTVNGTNWVPIYFNTPNGLSTDIFTTNNTYIVPCGGFIQVRLAPFTFSSGTLTATWDSSSGTNLAGTNALLTSLVNQNNEVAPTSTVTRVASSITNVSLLVSNTARQAAYFYNESTSIAYLKLGTTASATSYTLQMTPLSFVTIDYDPVYTGEVDAIWVTANGAMQVTELT